MVALSCQFFCSNLPMRSFYFLLVTFLACALGAAAQAIVIGVDPVSPAALRPWVAASRKAYEGVYHFGESEAESDLVLLVSGGLVTAQIRSSEWLDKADRFRSVYRTLTQVRISGRKFYSAEISGDFVSLIYEGKKTYGLKVASAWSGSAAKGQAEVGVLSGGIRDYYAGKFPQATYSLLDASALAGYSKSQLVLMRNEIFARYGYIFSSGSEMQAHFSKQDWYTADRKDVSPLLTAIEKKNLALLKALEAQR